MSQFRHPFQLTIYTKTIKLLSNQITNIQLGVTKMLLTTFVHESVPKYRNYFYSASHSPTLLASIALLSWPNDPNAL